MTEFHKIPANHTVDSHWLTTETEMATKKATKATKKSAKKTAKKTTKASTAKKATKKAVKKASSTTTKKATAKKAASKKTSSKRELIAPRGDKRYIRRDEKGRIKESDDQGRSLSQDVKKRAKKKVSAGQGDRGDQKRRK